MDVAHLGSSVAPILAFVHMFGALYSVMGLCFLVLANEEPELRHWMPVESLLLSLHGHNPFQGSHGIQDLGTTMQGFRSTAGFQLSVCIEEHPLRSRLVNLAPCRRSQSPLNQTNQRNHRRSPQRSRVLL